MEAPSASGVLPGVVPLAEFLPVSAVNRVVFWVVVDVVQNRRSFTLMTVVCFLSGGHLTTPAISLLDEF